MTMAMKKFLLVLMIVVVSSGLIESFEIHESELASEKSLWQLYRRWSNHHEISRSHTQKRKRFNAFKHNARHVFTVNQMNKPYKLRLNKFADMSNYEFVNLYAPSNLTHYKNLYGRRSSKDLANARSGAGLFMYEKATNLPSSIDWREKGAVNQIKNQYTCQSCWAFATVAAVEGINQIKTKKLLSLSEQELVDCDSRSGGCYGGYMTTAFDFIRKNGITTENNYPYYSVNQYCHSWMMNSPRVTRVTRVTIDGYEEVPARDENALMKAVAHQPVTVGIAASGSDFQFYWKGVFEGYCGAQLNHAVVAIGYGTTEDGRDYWIVRNSWGTQWGEDGYIRLRRGNQDPAGQCGIAMSPSYPIKNN